MGRRRSRLVSSSLYQLTRFDTSVLSVVRTHYHQYSSVIISIRYLAFFNMDNMGKKYALTHEICGVTAASSSQSSPTLIQLKHSVLGSFTDSLLLHSVMFRGNIEEFLPCTCNS